MKILCSFLKILLLLIFTFGSLYFGLGGVIRANYDEEVGQLVVDTETESEDSKILYDGFEFENFSELKVHLATMRIPQFYEWVVVDISGFMALVITSLCFGLLGSLIFLMRKNSRPISQLSLEQIILFPLYGMLTGLVVLGLSYIIPFFLTTDQANLRPISLMFLSLLAGTFIDVFYEKVLQFFKKDA